MENYNRFPKKQKIKLLVISKARIFMQMNILNNLARIILIKNVGIL